MAVNHLRSATTLKPVCGARGRVIRYSYANVTCKRCKKLATARAGQVDAILTDEDGNVFALEIKTVGDTRPGNALTSDDILAAYAKPDG